MNQPKNKLQIVKAIESAAKVLEAAEGDDDELASIDDIPLPVSEEPSLARFLDTVVFLETFELAKMPPDSPEWTKGLALAKLTQPAFLLDAASYLEPLFTLRGFGKYKLKWKALAKPSTTKDRFLQRGTFLRNFIGELALRPQVFRDTFPDARLLQVARRLADVAAVKTATEALAILGTIRSVGGMTRLRAWGREAVKESGVEVNEFDETVAAVGEVQDLGKQIADTEIRLQDPSTSTEAEELAAKQVALRQQLSEAVANSPNPAATLTVAAQAAQPRAYRTQVGEKLKMNPVQETAMMRRGKVIIAAGAGSGKTRVLSGKVVFHINEEGAPAESVLATSFTRKSAAELKDRIIKAGGDIERGVANDGFGTTHSIASKLIKRFRPDIQHRKGIGGKDGHSQTTLYKLAIAQVEMKPRGVVTSRPDPNESFFSSASIADTMKTLAPEPAAPPPSMATPGAPGAISFSDAVDQGLAWLSMPGSTETLKTTIPWVQRWVAEGKSAPNWLWLFKRLKSGQLAREAMAKNERDRFMEVMRAGRINFVPGVSAAYDSSLSLFAATPSPVQFSVIQAAGKKSDFSQYKDTPANQWFNQGAQIETMIQSDPKAAAEVLKDFTPGNVGRSITKWKGGLVTPGQAYAQTGGSLEAAAYAAYEWIKGNDPIYAGSGDPDDLLINFSKLAISDPKFRDALQRRFKYVLIDEAQDQNPAQHLMFGLITGFYDPATQQPRTDGAMSADTYAMIGDDKQAIYEFRGAAPTIFIDNSDSMGGEFKTDYLDTNYRSGKQIVEAASNIISYNSHQIPMVCKPFPARGEGAVRVVDAGVGQSAYLAAAAMVAEQVKAGVSDGDDYKDYGVGCRTNKEAYSFTTALLAGGIPFRSKYNPLTHWSTQALINWIVLANADATNKPLIDGLVVKCLAAPAFDINKKTLEDRLQQMAALPENQGKTYLQILEAGGWNQVYLDKSGTGRPTIRNQEKVKPYLDALLLARTFTGSPSEVIIRVLNEIKGADGISMVDTLTKKEGERESDDTSEEEVVDAANESPEDQQKRLQEAALAPLSPVIELATNYGDLSSFIAYLRDLARANDKVWFNDGETSVQEKVLNAVNVDTVHGWKGLEVKHMYVPMAAGMFPFFKGDTDSERRLAYVAITRGEDSVTVFNIQRVDPKTKMPYSSRFIQEMSCGRPMPETPVSVEGAFKLATHALEEVAVLLAGEMTDGDDTAPLKTVPEDEMPDEYHPEDVLMTEAQEDAAEDETATLDDDGGPDEEVAEEIAASALAKSQALMARLKR